MRTCVFKEELKSSGKFKVRVIGTPQLGCRNAKSKLEESLANIRSEMHTEQEDTAGWKKAREGQFVAHEPQLKETGLGGRPGTAPSHRSQSYRSQCSLSYSWNLTQELYHFTVKVWGARKCWCPTVRSGHADTRLSNSHSRIFSEECLWLTMVLCLKRQRMNFPILCFSDL